MNKMRISPDGLIELRTFGYHPDHPSETTLLDEEDGARFWVVEFQDETTGQKIFQYGLSSICNWDSAAEARKEDLRLMAKSRNAIRVERAHCPAHVLRPGGHHVQK